MLYDWPLNRRVVPRLVWASSTGANKPTLERLRRPRPQRVNWLVSSTTCLKTSSPTKNLTRLATNYDSKNPPSANSKGRPLLWAIHCCQPPPFPQFLKIRLEYGHMRFSLGGLNGISLTQGRPSGLRLKRK